MNYSTQFLQDCDHEEADTRIALHLYDAINRGARNVLVRTVDTDVIVILIGLFFLHQLIGYCYNMGCFWHRKIFQILQY